MFTSLLHNYFFSVQFAHPALHQLQRLSQLQQGPVPLQFPLPDVVIIMDATPTTIPQTGDGLIPGTLITWHGEHSQLGKPSCAQDIQLPINLTIPRLMSSRTPHQILPQIQIMTLIL